MGPPGPPGPPGLQGQRGIPGERGRDGDRGSNVRKHKITTLNLRPWNIALRIRQISYYQFNETKSKTYSLEEMENHYYLDKTHLFPYLRMQVYETYM